MHWLPPGRPGRDARRERRIATATARALDLNLAISPADFVADEAYAGETYGVLSLSSIWAAPARRNFVWAARAERLSVP